MGNGKFGCNPIEEGFLTQRQINEEHESLKQKWNSISQMMK
jgi:hypothetical protein